MAGLPSPIERINDPFFYKKGLEVFIKRDDLIHPYIMGNKWRKLKYNLKHAQKQHFEGILTLGGAFSNHIAATAAACSENKLKSIGIIRGEELNPQSNATLRFASGQGMQLRFVSRETYRTLRNTPTALQNQYPEYFVLPEGGTNHLAIRGCAELVEELTDQYDYLILPVGTGGTMAGLLKGMKGSGQLIGVSSLKGDFIKDEFKELTKAHHIPYINYQIINRFHFGGYGRVNDELIRFINRTKQNIGLLFDPIYTAKMYFGVRQLAEERFFGSGSRLLIVHTGGLQGIAGYNEFHQKKISI